MKYYILIVIFLFVSCKQKDHLGKYVVNDKIGLDDYWRKVIGYDSLQITCNYAGDRLNYNFCYLTNLTLLNTKSTKKIQYL